MRRARRTREIYRNNPGGAWYLEPQGNEQKQRYKHKNTKNDADSFRKRLPVSGAEGNLPGQGPT